MGNKPFANLEEIYTPLDIPNWSHGAHPYQDLRKIDLPSEIDTESEIYSVQYRKDLNF